MSGRIEVKVHGQALAVYLSQWATNPNAIISAAEAHQLIGKLQDALVLVKANAPSAELSRLEAANAALLIGKLQDALVLVKANAPSAELSRLEAANAALQSAVEDDFSDIA